MKATITITDTANGKCTLEVHFDPPLKQGPPESQSHKAALICLRAVKEQAAGFKQTFSHTTTKPEDNS